MRTTLSRVGAALGLLLVVGCSSEAAPVPDPLPPASSPASPSSSPTADALPSPEESGTKGEIERAVLAYFAAINTAFATNDTAGLPATYTSDCKGCAAFKKGIDDVLATDRRFDGARDEITFRKVVEGTGGVGFVGVDLRVTAHRLVDAGGKTVIEYPASTAVLNLTVFKTPEGWKVIDVADASPTAAATP